MSLQWREVPDGKWDQKKNHSAPQKPYNDVWILWKYYETNMISIQSSSLEGSWIHLRLIIIIYTVYTCKNVDPSSFKKISTFTLIQTSMVISYQTNPCCLKIAPANPCHPKCIPTKPRLQYPNCKNTSGIVGFAASGVSCSLEILEVGIAVSRGSVAWMTGFLWWMFVSSIPCEGCFWRFQLTNLHILHILHFTLGGDHLIFSFRFSACFSGVQIVELTNRPDQLHQQHSLLLTFPIAHLHRCCCDTHWPRTLNATR